MLQQILHVGWIASFILSGTSIFVFFISFILSVFTHSVNIYGFVFIGLFLWFGLLGLALLDAWSIRKNWQISH